MGEKFDRPNLHGPRTLPQARIQHHQALALYTKSLGVENPETAKTTSRPGRTAWLQGDNSNAAAMIRQTLAIERRLLGTDDSNTLYSMNSLASVYRWQRKGAQTEALYRQTLKIRRRILGTKHTDTLTSMNDLANVHWSPASVRKPKRSMASSSRAAPCTGSRTS
jgi:hypothetical protein